MDPDRPAGEEPELGSARGGPGAKRHVGLIIGIAVVAVAVVAAAVAGALLLLRKSESPTMMALKSGQAMASAAGLSFSGTTAGGAASLTVTRQDTVEGSYAQERDRVGVVMINGVAYLKAPAPGTTLALVAGELKKDAPIAKAVAAVGEVLLWDVPQRGLQAWVAERQQLRARLVGHSPSD